MRPAAALDDEGATREVEVEVGPVAKPDPWATRLLKVRERLAQARAWRAWLDAEPGRVAVELAWREGVSGPRVGQVLALLNLAPPIVAILDVPEGLGPKVTHLEVLRIARIKSRKEQMQEFWRLVTEREWLSAKCHGRYRRCSRRTPRDYLIVRASLRQTAEASTLGAWPQTPSRSSPSS